MTPHTDAGALLKLAQKWRAEAKRHADAASEPGMDAQEYTLHDEADTVYRKCADEVSAALAVPPRSEVQSAEPITREEMVEMFGSEAPIEAINLIWNAPDHKTLADIRRELREIAAKQSRTVAQASRTWDVALAERVQQLEAAGADNLSCAQIIGLIAFIRDGEGSAQPSAHRQCTYPKCECGDGIHACPEATSADCGGGE